MTGSFGDPHHGFARIYCDACGHDYLLAFSCKMRYFCPSCHQKRVLLYGEWVEENILAPVPHRQYVFTMPRLLRPIFARRRETLLAEGFRRAVLDFLVKNEALADELRKRMLTWDHRKFSRKPAPR